MKKSTFLLFLLISLLLRASEHKYPSFDFSNNPYNTAFKSNSRYTRMGSADVNLATGHFTMQKNLLTLPGRGDLSPSINLSYFSTLASHPGSATPETTYTGEPIGDSTFVILDLPGMGEMGWNVIMGEVYFFRASSRDYSWIRLGDGNKHQIVSYYDDGEKLFLPDMPDWDIEWCEFDSLYSLVFTSPEGVRYVFDRFYGRWFWYDEISYFLTLTKIVDRFGNYIKIDYSGEMDTLDAEPPWAIADSTIGIEKMRHIEKITSPTGDSAVFHYSDDSLYLESISYWNSEGEEVKIKFEYQLDTLEEAISMWRGDTVKLLSSVGYYDPSNELLYPSEGFEYNDKGVLSEYHHPYGGIEEYSFEEVTFDTTINDSNIISRYLRLTEINIKKDSESEGNKYIIWYGDGEGNWDPRNPISPTSSVGNVVGIGYRPTYALPMYKAVKLQSPDNSYSVYSFTDKPNNVNLLGVFEEGIDFNEVGDTLRAVKNLLKMDNNYPDNSPFASSAGRLIESDGIKTFTAYMTENVAEHEIMLDTVVQVQVLHSYWGVLMNMERGAISKRVRVARPEYAPYQAVLYYGEIDSVRFTEDSTNFDVWENNNIRGDNRRKRSKIEEQNTSRPIITQEEILNTTSADWGDILRSIYYNYDWGDRVNLGNYGHISSYNPEYAYNDKHILVQTYIGDGPKTDYWYDKVGNIIKTSYGGSTTKYEFDASTEYSRPSKKIDFISGSDSLITEFSYYSNTGLLQEVTEPNGNTTVFKYDELGRIIKVIKPGDNINSPTIEYGYDDSSRKKWGKVKGEEKMYTFYDGLGRRIQTQRKDSQNGMTVVQSFGYDERGRLINILLPVYSGVSIGSFDEVNSFDGEVMPSPDMYKSFYYDAFGRDTLIRTPIEDGNAYTRYQYQGNEVIIITPEGDTVKKVYDSFGNGTRTRIIGYGNEDSLITEFEYDNIGQLKKITDPEEKEILYSYNGWGKIISENSPDKGLIEMEYNNTTGLLISSIDSTDRGKAEFKTYQYDDYGRLILKGLIHSIWYDTTYYDSTECIVDGCSDASLWTDIPEGCLSVTAPLNYDSDCFQIESPDTGGISSIYRSFDPMSLVQLEFDYTFGLDTEVPDSTFGQFEVIIINIPSDSLFYSFTDTIDHVNDEIPIRSYHIWRRGITLDFDSLPNPDFNLSCVNKIMFRFLGATSNTEDTVHLYINNIRITVDKEYERVTIIEKDSLIKADSLYYDSYDNFNLSVPDSINNPKGRLVRTNDETGWQMFFYDNRGRTAGKWQYIGWLNDTLKVYYQYNSADKLVSMTYPDGSKVNYNYTNSGLLEE
ncbi:RHS repeat protein, partial [candidate division WOR-3 bacterium]|nr:RHS repeat protein [candidate division WOR-3 bacterium]